MSLQPLQVFLAYTVSVVHADFVGVVVCLGAAKEYAVIQCMSKVVGVLQYGHVHRFGFCFIAQVLQLAPKFVS